MLPKIEFKHPGNLIAALDARVKLTAADRQKSLCDEAPAGRL